MNTPAHIVLSAVVLGSQRFGIHWRAILAGALLPDLPMFGFYFYQRIARAQTEETIWSTLYFETGWQQFFDLFNSVPLIALGLAIAAYRRSPSAIALFLSMALHVAADLPLHREDAHGHFYPLSEWRFISPVSYWDPAYFGRMFAAIEMLGVVAGSVVLIRRGGPWQPIGTITLGLYAIFALLAFLYWRSL